MSGSSRSRQKRKLEPISIEELAGTTGMSGFCSFLTRDASVSVPVLDALESSAPETDALDYPALDYSPQRRPRIRETSTVQDGHSLAEQAVYDVTYRAGKPYQGESRILTIGLRTLAEMSRMAYSNCKANVRSLVEKLAIDERDGFSYTQGR